MTESTARFLFEHKMLDAATHLSVRLAGNVRAYVILLDQDGLVQQVLFKHQEDTWFEFVDSLRVQGTPHVFFNPSTLPHRIWMSWLGVSHRVLIRLFDLDLNQLDLKTVNVEDESDEMRAQSELVTLPDTWEVMFEIKNIKSSSLC